MSSGPTSNITERAVKLLGSGIGPEQAALALGITTSRISQLLSTPEIMAEVSELRFKNLSKHNDRDDKYDELEDDLIQRLRDCLPLMLRPMEILKAISVINSAKRRGAATPEQITNQQTVVNLTIPVQIVHRFIKNINNQVIETGTATETQKLVTIQSGVLLSQVKEQTIEAQKQLEAPVNQEVLVNESQRSLANRETVEIDL